MKDYSAKDPKFFETIQITETTDTSHADNINAAPKQLLENTLVLKQEIGSLKPDAFDSMKSYSKGECVTMGGNVYQALEDMDAGEWDASKWTPTSTFMEISELKNLISELRREIDRAGQSQIGWEYVEESETLVYVQGTSGSGIVGYDADTELLYMTGFAASLDAVAERAAAIVEGNIQQISKEDALGYFEP